MSYIHTGSSDYAAIAGRHTLLLTMANAVKTETKLQQVGNCFRECDRGSVTFRFTGQLPFLQARQRRGITVAFWPSVQPQ